MSVVGVTYVVMMSTPLLLAVLVDTKPVPVIVIARSGEPAGTVDGLRLVIAGTPLSTVNASAADVPPPGAELTTRTEIVPAFASCAAVSVALRCVASWYVVAAGAPSNVICDVMKKPRPVTTTSVGPEPTARARRRERRGLRRRVLHAEHDGRGETAAGRRVAHRDREIAGCAERRRGHRRRELRAFTNVVASAAR